MTRKGTLILYADGGISPARAGAGVVGQDADGFVLLLGNRPLPLMTSTEAEYAALVLALEVAAKRGEQEIEIRMDNEVVIQQMAGRFAVNSARLKPWHRQACDLARAFRQVTYRHVPRDQNQIANALASEAVAGRTWCMRGTPCG